MTAGQAMTTGGASDGAGGARDGAGGGGANFGGVPPVRRPQTTPGPAWSGDIGPESPWGAWLDVPSGGLVAVDLRWSEGLGVPTVRLATPEGEWWVPNVQPGPPVHRAWIEVPPGWTWISVEEAYAESLHIDVATHLPVSGPPTA